MESQGFNHIHLQVTDLERSAHFYREAFGLEELYRQPTQVFLNTPGCNDVVTLSQADAARVDHVGFLVPDRSRLDAAVARAEQAGGRVVERHDMEGGSPTAFVEDPDGFVVQL